jgi:hypothetical protein
VDATLRGARPCNVWGTWSSRAWPRADIVVPRVRMRTDVVYAQLHCQERPYPYSWAANLTDWYGEKGSR